MSVDKEPVKSRIPEPLARDGVLFQAKPTELTGLLSITHMGGNGVSPFDVYTSDISDKSPDFWESVRKRTQSPGNVVRGIIREGKIALAVVQEHRFLYNAHVGNSVAEPVRDESAIPFEVGSWDKRFRVRIAHGKGRQYDEVLSGFKKYLKRNMPHKTPKIDRKKHIRI